MDIGDLTGAISIEDQFSGTIETAIHYVEEFSSKFVDGMGPVAVAAGVASAAITGITAATTALGVKGSEVNDVTTTFDHFAERVGGAENAIDGLRQGVKGTVDDMVLMRDANLVLGAGAKVSADDLKTMGDAAFVLQNRGLGPTKEMLDLITSAMVTGRTRTLAMKLGVVDSADATQAYADKLGILKSEMTQTQLAEAHRIAVIDLLRGAVADAGTQSLDFGEKIESVEAALSNWVDELSSAVAKSPELARALQAVEDELAKFGDGKGAIDGIVSAIEAFARAIEAVAPVAGATARAVVDVVSTATDFKEVLGGLVVLVGAYKLAVVASTAATVEDTVAITANTAAKARNAETTLAATTGLSTVRAGIQGVAEAMGLMNPVVFEGVAAEATLTGTLGFLAVATVSAASVVRLLATAWENHRESVERAAAAERQAAIDVANLARLNAAMGTSFTDINAAVAEWIRRNKDAKPAVDAHAQAVAALAAKLKAHEAAVHAAMDSVVQASESFNVQREAMARLGDQVLFTRDAQLQFVAAMDKIIESGRALTAEEAARYTAITNDRLALVAHDEEMLKAHGITLDMINAGKALGLTEQEMAQKWGVTTQALKEYGSELNTVKALTREVSDLEMEASGHTAEKLAQDRENEKQDAIRNFKGTSVEFDAFMQQIDKKYDLLALTGSQSWKAVEDSSISALQNQLAEHTRTYEHMAATGNFFRADMDKELEKINQLKEKLHQTSTVTSTEMTPSFLQFATSMDNGVATFDSMGTAMAAVDQGFDASKVKVKMLNGEILSLTDAIARFNAGNTYTYTLTTREGVEQYRSMNTGMNIAWSDEQIMAFAAAGGTLAQLMQMGVIKMRGGIGGTAVTTSGPPPTTTANAATTTSTTPAATTPAAASNVVAPAVSAGGNISITNYITASALNPDEAAAKIGTVLMDQLKMRRLLPTAG